MLKLLDMDNVILIEYTSHPAINADAKPPRLDQFVAEQLPQLSRSQIQRLIEDKQILVDEQAAKANHRLRPGQQIKITSPPLKDSHIEAEAIPLDIIYEDDHLAVINKPIGMITHPGAGVHSGTLVHALMHHMQGSLSGIGGVLRPGIVHRLDKDTSGLLVIAKSDQAHQHLAKQIQNKEAQRIYLAILEGRLPKRQGKVNAPLGRHPVRRTEIAILPTGREAETLYKVLDASESVLVGKNLHYFSLVELTLRTGRTHQIRVHMTSLNCPVVGDIIYNRKTTGTPLARKKLGLQGQALHAHKLSFTHPVSNQIMNFVAPLPAEYLVLAKKIFPAFDFD
jgi:23S rRNA pseudouridine1911/1915/1917 synthase